VQSVHITTKVVSPNPVHGDVYSVNLYYEVYLVHLYDAKYSVIVMMMCNQLPSTSRHKDVLSTPRNKGLLSTHRHNNYRVLRVIKMY
jgi:hypothetical protein